MFTKTDPAPSGPASRAIARALAGFVFPSRCLACATEPVRAFFRGGVCEPCWAALPRADDSRCDTCDESLPALDALRCGRCLLDPPPYSRLVAAAPYRSAARRILLAFKFRGADYLAPRLAGLMVERLALPDVDEIAAVPATPRARRRAPHAADLLAAALARRLGRPFVRGRIAKRRETERQSGLPLERRAENVRGAFRASRPAPPRVLLVDDVATSGATARECARALLAAGAREVAVACFARASRQDIALEPAP